MRTNTIFTNIYNGTNIYINTNRNMRGVCIHNTKQNTCYHSVRISIKEAPWRSG